MKLTVVFACLVISAASAAENDSIVACYMDASMQPLFFPVNPLLCTHIIYSSAYIGDDLRLKTSSLDVDPFSSTLKMLKRRNPALKMLLGVGVKQSRLEMLSQQQITLDDFINSTLIFVKKNNYDGVELTWLENDSDEALRNTESLTNFIKELKGWGDQAEKKSLLVSVSLPDHSEDTRTRNDKKTLSQYVDFICLLPLRPIVEEPQIDNTVSYWQDQVNPKKLILAMPAIVQQSRKRHSNFQSSVLDINLERKVEQMNGPGLIIGKQVCQAIKSGQKELKTLTKLQSAQHHWEDVSGLLQKGLGGVGVVMLDKDTFLNTICLNCTQEERAVLEVNVITRHHHKHHHHRHGHHGHGYQGHGHHGHGHHGHHHGGHGHHGHHHHGHSHHGHRHHRRGHRHGHHNHGHNYSNQVEFKDKRAA